MALRDGRFDPTQLKPFDRDANHAIHVVIETPRGSRNKVSFDEDLGVFRLKKVLPEGMSFPYDFGFVPSTLADDGDPLDVLVLMDEAAFTGGYEEYGEKFRVLGCKGPRIGWKLVERAARRWRATRKRRDRR